MNTTKRPATFLKWHGDKDSKPIDRDDAAQLIRSHRRLAREGVSPQREVRLYYREIYIAIRALGVAVCIHH